MTRITDEAVEAAARVFYGGVYGSVGDEGNKLLHDGARAALEAALPYLAPRPVVDREGVRKTVQRWMPGGRTRHIDDLTDAVMELARPMPTREQVADALNRVRDTEGRFVIPGRLLYEGSHRLLADAVLALIGGEKAHDPQA